MTIEIQVSEEQSLRPEAQSPSPEEQSPPPEEQSLRQLEPPPGRKMFVVIAAMAVISIVALIAILWINKTRSTISLDEFTVPVESKSLTLRITASGKIVPFQSVNLSPKLAGVLRQLMVEQGQQVKKGQVVARMDTSDLEGPALQAQAAVQVAEAAYQQAVARLAELQAGSRREEITQAQARLVQAKAQYSRQWETKSQLEATAVSQAREAEAQAVLAEKRYQRYKVLQEKGATTLDRLNEEERNWTTARLQFESSKQQLSQVRKQIESDILQAQGMVAEAEEALKLAQAGTRPEIMLQAQAEVKRAEAEVARTKGALRTITVQAGDTLIRAPFDGMVTQKYASEGAFVTPTTSASSTSSATSTSIIALARDLEVVADVPEVDIGQIKQDQVVDIRADAFPDQIFKGRVRLISPEAVVEQNVTSFQVRIAVVTGQDKLRSGMNADLTFLGDTVKNALVVPTVAIATRKGQTGVYLPGDNNKPEFQAVTIGSSVQDKTQILDGLSSKDRVFIDFPKGKDPDESET